MTAFPVFSLVLAAALSSPSAGTMDSVDSHTVALWTFDQWNGQSQFDAGPHALHLAATQAFPLEASPEDSALVLKGVGGLSLPNTERIAIGPTGQLTYQARIWLDAYPSAQLHNQFSFLMGKYEGMGLFIRSDGRLQVNNQKGGGSSWMWYAPTTAAGVVPLKQWVEVAAACDQATSECYVYVNGKAQATYTYMVGEWYEPLFSYAGPQFRSTASVFTVGFNSSDGQHFTGRIDAIRISDTLALGAGPKSITEPVDATSHFGLLPSTMALWTFDTYLIRGTVTNLKDPKRLTLESNSPPLENSPFGRSAQCKGLGCAFQTPADSSLTIGKTGRLTLEARLWLDEYPSPLLHNKASVIAGQYEGLKLLLFSDGRIQAGAQSSDGEADAWFAPLSQPGVIPLKRWVDVAVAADASNGQLYAYVDGKPIQLYVPKPVESYGVVGFRSSNSDFTIGRDAIDEQAFKGRIDEVRVSNSLVLGPGLALMQDSAILGGAEVGKPQAYQVHLGMQSYSAAPGDTLDVPVFLVIHDMVSISGCQMKLAFDTSLVTLLSVSKDSGLARDWTLFDWSRSGANPVTIAMGGAKLPLGYGEGEWLRLRFFIHPDAKLESRTSLALTDIQLDETGHILPSVRQGQIVVRRSDRIYGDVTGNGKVEVFDAALILKKVVDPLSLPDSDFPAFTLATADVSGNGEITSYDAALVLQYSLGLLAEFPVQVPKPLAKGAARADYVPTAALNLLPSQSLADGKSLFSLEGKELEGLSAAEWVFSLDANLGAVTQVSSSIPSARLAWSYDPASRQLKVSLATANALGAGLFSLVNIQTTQESGASSGGLVLVSAYLNEGKIKGTEFSSQPNQPALDLRRPRTGPSRHVLSVPRFQQGRWTIPLQTPPSKGHRPETLMDVNGRRQFRVSP
jgi:Concanavalin A-like lectin/glucanases superfamily/Dockerin type I domain